MREKHYKSMLSAFVNHELSKSDQQQIAEHLMQCPDCRAEHDQVKLGASLAGRMEQADAPVRVWNQIENALDPKRGLQVTLIPESTFGPRNVLGYAVGLLVMAGFVTGAYFMLFRTDSNQAARVEIAMPQPVQTLQPVTEIAANNTNVAPIPEAVHANTNTNSNQAIPANVEQPTLASVPAFEFETLAGAPKVGAASTANRLAVGDFLETDAASSARIEVANIGSVEIQPNSRVKLIGTNPKQHRLSLEHGTLQAQILAPPRLFIVDTPSAVAVDLGCAYKLEVDKAGNSYLHVTSGFVALERGGRESIVPAGAMCATRRGKGLGTPFSAETTEKFRSALERFDFSNGGDRAVQTMLDNRNFYDMITLWHLLSRVQKADREKIFDALADYVKPPDDITREGILTLDKKMLASWRGEVERVWFE